MTTPQSTPSITVGKLASELGTSISDVETLAAELDGPPYTRSGRLTGAAADSIRRMCRDTDPEDPAYGITISSLARELGMVRCWVMDQVDALLADGRLIVWTERDTLSAAAADAIRETYRADMERATTSITVAELARDLGLGHGDVAYRAHSLDAERLGFPVVYLDARTGRLSAAAADAIRTAYRAEQEMVRGTSRPGPMAVTGFHVYYGPEIPGTMKQIASLMIRLDMDRVDGDQTPSYENRTAADRGVMAWAVSTAGSLFDQHDLWDYDLLSDADHVHRCFTHRHLFVTDKDRRLFRA